jgi:hypothetical protein
MKLDNGFHFSLNNQTIFQKRTIESTYPYLNSGTYEGKVTAPLFPSVYAAYKLDRLAFSIGFIPVGGGAGATYENGLPSFEMSQSDLVPALATSTGATEYDMDVYFKGSSIFFGLQGAVAYKINDWISVAAGARYVTAKNTYEGYLRDVRVNTAGGWMDASDILAGVAGNATTAANSTSGIMTAVPSAAGMTLAQAEASNNHHNRARWLFKVPSPDSVPLQLLLLPRLMLFSKVLHVCMAIKQLSSLTRKRMLNKPVQALLLFSALILHCSRISTLQSSMKWLPSLSSRTRRQKI